MDRNANGIWFFAYIVDTNPILIDITVKGILDFRVSIVVSNDLFCVEYNIFLTLGTKALIEEKYMNFSG